MQDSAPGLTDTSRGTKPGTSCSTHSVQHPHRQNSYHWLSVLLHASATAPSTEPEPGTVSQQWDVFAGPWGRRKAVGQQRHAGVGERAGERVSEPWSGLTGFTGSRWKLCEHDCAGLSLPPAASRHSTPKRAGPVGTSLNSS